MSRKTILEQLNMAQAELEERYMQVKSMRVLADELGVSRASLQKYLSHMPKNKPWSAKHRSIRNNDYLRRRYRAQAMQSFERALLHKQQWRDINNRNIPRNAIMEMRVDPPSNSSIHMTVYATLRDGSEAIFRFQPSVTWAIDQEQVEHSAI